MKARRPTESYFRGLCAIHPATPTTCSETPTTWDSGGSHSNSLIHMFFSVVALLRAAGSAFAFYHNLSSLPVNLVALTLPATGCWPSSLVTVVSVLYICTRWMHVIDTTLCHYVHQLCLI